MRQCTAGSKSANHGINPIAASGVSVRKAAGSTVSVKECAFFEKNTCVSDMTAIGWDMFASGRILKHTYLWLRDDGLRREQSRIRVDEARVEDGTFVVGGV